MTRYNSFERMLSNENVSDVLPGRTRLEALSEYQKIYPSAKERLGVYAIELQSTREIALRNAVDELRRGHFTELAHIIEQGYILTDALTKDYPDHCRHYYSKVVPGVFGATRNIIVATIQNKVCGVIVLKKTAEERKICTLYVAKRYRHQGVGKTLLDAGLKWLDTTKPVITMGDDKVASFSKIIEHYKWQHTSPLPAGYYNNHSREFVFNEGN